MTIDEAATDEPTYDELVTITFRDGRVMLIPDDSEIQFTDANGVQHHLRAGEWLSFRRLEEGYDIPCTACGLQAHECEDEDEACCTECSDVAGGLHQTTEPS